MSVRNLEFLFRPGSVAVIGASDRPQSVGATVFRNLPGRWFRRFDPAGQPETRDGSWHQGVPGRGEFPANARSRCCLYAPTDHPRSDRRSRARGTRAAVVSTAGLGAITDESGHSLRFDWFSPMIPSG